MGKRRRKLFCCRISSYSGGPEARSLALNHSTMGEVIVGNPRGGCLKEQVERLFLSEKSGILTNPTVKTRKRHRKLPRNLKGQQDCRDFPWTGYNNDDRKTRNFESLKCSDT